MSRSIRIHILFFIIGGLIYQGIEALWKTGSGHPLHWTMAVAGGLSFVFIGLLNEGKNPPPIAVQMAIGAGFITVLEAILGLILNTYMGLDIWDYSNVPFNALDGNICLPFTLAWFLLSGVAIWLEDKLHEVFGGIKCQH